VILYAAKITQNGMTELFYTNKVPTRAEERMLSPKQAQTKMITLGLWRQGSLTDSALASGLSGPGLSPGQGPRSHYVLAQDILLTVSLYESSLT